MTRNKFIILLTAAIIAAVGVVSLVFLLTRNEPPVEDSDVPTVIEPETALSELDKEQISLIANTSLEKLGTYGWRESELLAPMNLQTAMIDGSFYASFGGLSHTTVRDVEASLQSLTGGKSFNKLVNTTIYTTPFAITSEYTDSFLIPNDSKNIDGFPSVELSTPVDSRVVYLAQTPNTRNNDGELIPGVMTVNTLEFEGSFSLVISYKNGKWIVTDFKQTTDVFAIDNNFTFMNGDFGVFAEIVPVSFTAASIQANGTLGETEDRLPDFLKYTGFDPVREDTTVTIEGEETNE